MSQCSVTYSYRKNKNHNNKHMNNANNHLKFYLGPDIFTSRLPPLIVGILPCWWRHTLFILSCGLCKETFTCSCGCLVGPGCDWIPCSSWYTWSTTPKSRSKFFLWRSALTRSTSSASSSFDTSKNKDVPPVELGRGGMDCGYKKKIQ